jgi:hypothetical protein
MNHALRSLSKQILLFSAGKYSRRRKKMECSTPMGSDDGDSSSDVDIINVSFGEMGLGM